MDILKKIKCSEKKNFCKWLSIVRRMKGDMYKNINTPIKVKAPIVPLGIP